MNTKAKLMLLSVVLAAASLLAVGGEPAFASGSVPSGVVSSGSRPRVNNVVTAGYPLTKESKGAKVFGMDTAATLVVDEQGNVPVAGGLATIEIGYLTGIGSSSCYAMVFDSSVASDTTEAGSVSRMLMPPMPAVTSAVTTKEFAYPKQFNKGLVVLVGGAGAANCRASVSWITNGGAE